MGLTSGQGRLLMLTSRLSDIQLDETMLSQRQNQLAWHAEKAAKEYNEKTNNMKLVMKVNDDNEKIGWKREDLSYNNMTSMGYLITDSSNNIYLTKTNGKWDLPKADNLEKGQQEMFDGDVVNGKVKLKGKDIEYNVIDATEFLNDKSKLQNKIMNGTLFVLNTTGNDTTGSPVNELASNTGMEWVYDTSDDAEAESKYQYETSRISRQDNMLDMEIKQLETQHNAVAKEMESVQKLIDDNVERTFNLFSS